MNVYLAGRARDFEQFREQARALERLGRTVVSTWHDSANLAGLLERRFEQIIAADQAKMQRLRDLLTRETHEFDSREAAVPQGLDSAIEKETAKVLQEIRSADWVVADANGGAMEAGYGIALKKHVIVFGGLPTALSFASDELAADLISACTFLVRETSPLRRLSIQKLR